MWVDRLHPGNEDHRGEKAGRPGNPCYQHMSEV